MALTTRSAIDPEEVRAQLYRILSSKGFASSSSLARFLRYVVEETLAGHGEGLKEFHLGVEIFGRGDAFDPRIDPIVRVQARNARIKLDRYYAEAGPADTILIRLPKGCYVPEFSYRSVQPVAEDRPVELPVEEPPVPAPVPVSVYVPPAPVVAAARWRSPHWAVAPLCLVIALSTGLLYQGSRNGLVAGAPRVLPAVPAAGSEVRALYLRGRYLLDRQTEDSLHKALACFRQAVAAEPAYAPAWAGLADTYDVMSQFGMMAPQEGMSEARRAAQKALSLDPNLAEAHQAMAAILEAYDWNWKAAEREYKRAIELDPNLAPAHAWYGMFLREQGRLPDAQVELELAHRLDPLSINTNFNLANVYAMRGNFDAAIRHVKVVAELEPLSPKPALMLAHLYRKTQQPELAREMIEKARVMAPTNPMSLSRIAAAYAAQGRKDDANKLLDDLRRLSRERYVSPYCIASVYLAMRDVDRAMPYLEAAYRERSTGLVFLREARNSEAYRASHRFRKLVDRMRFSG